MFDESVLVLRSGVFMFRVSRLCAIIIVALLVATAAHAYGAKPLIVVRPGQDVRVAQMCPPRISPQMAAAFGLPVLTVRPCAAR